MMTMISWRRLGQNLSEHSIRSKSVPETWLRKVEIELKILAAKQKYSTILDRNYKWWKSLIHLFQVWKICFPEITPLEVTTARMKTSVLIIMTAWRSLIPRSSLSSERILYLMLKWRSNNLVILNRCWCMDQKAIVMSKERIKDMIIFAEYWPKKIDLKSLLSIIITTKFKV